MDLLTLTSLCLLACAASNSVHGESKLGGLEEKFSWKKIDLAYESDEARQKAIADKSFIPENNLPTGISVYTAEGKVFLSIARRQEGIPATLVYFSANDADKSPKLIPYPSFSANEPTSCDNLINVNRGMRIDKYNRLWVFDSGKVGYVTASKEICKPRIHIFNLDTNEKILMYTLKDGSYHSDSVFTSVVVDSGDTADTTYMYIAEQTGIIVFSLEHKNCWRFENSYFSPDPNEVDYSVGGVKFTWSSGGLFGMALSPAANNEKTLYFHPISSLKEFSVSTKVLKDKEKTGDNKDKFKYVGSRGDLGRSTSEVMDKSGILFFNLLDINGVGCWNSEREYTEGSTLGVIAKDDERLVFPADSIVDGEQRLWVLSNRGPVQAYGKLDYSDTNFRVFNGLTSKLVANTVCEPLIQLHSEE